MQELNASGPGDGARILVVGEGQNVSGIEAALEQEGLADVRHVPDPDTMLEVFGEFQPDIVVLAANGSTPEVPELVRRIEAVAFNGRPVPILVISDDSRADVRTRLLAQGAIDVVPGPADPVEVALRTRNLIRLGGIRHDHYDHVEVSATQLRAAEVDMANRLALVAEYRDYPDASHVQRVGRLSAMLAARVGMSETDVGIIRFAAPLHDIGKIAIPDAILLKPAPLTLDELDIMKSHTTIGARMLAGSRSPILRMGEDIAHYHHEAWDGTGYMPGLSGEDIPLPGRIVAVADVFDALTHTRPYKRAWTIQETVDWILSVRERKFDPAVVDALIDSVDEIASEPTFCEASAAMAGIEPLPVLD